MESDQHKYWREILAENVDLINSGLLHEGRYPKGETRRWESIDMMEKRLLGVLNKYMDYDKILIVTHGMLMHQIKPYGHIPNCFVDSFIYDEHFKCAGFHKK